MTPEDRHAHAVRLAELRERQPDSTRYAFLFEGPQAVERWAKKGVPVYVNMYCRQYGRDPEPAYTAGQPAMYRLNDRTSRPDLAYRIRVRFKQPFSPY